LEDAIKDRMENGRKPKAIILVHLYGMPARIDEIMTIARKYEIPVIEDAAEALGSTYNGKKLGTFGDLGIFSFNGNKIITTSGGGALVSENASWIKKAKFLATQARDQAAHYQHSEIGYNYRLSNICAGIGRGQLKVLDDRVKSRRRVFGEYQKAFHGIGGISFQPEPVNAFSNRWLTCMLMGDKTKMDATQLRIELEKQNIESRPLWKPMHLQPVFANAPHYGGSVSEQLFSKGICLPSGSNMTDDDLNRVIDAVKVALT
jgi:dTDP-4-amino-4,6-dideoxygalactose transaminase